MQIAAGFLTNEASGTYAEPLSLARAKSTEFEQSLSEALAGDKIVPLSRISARQDRELERLAYAVPASLVRPDAPRLKVVHSFRTFRRHARDAAYAARMLRGGIVVRGLRDGRNELEFLLVPTTALSRFAEEASLEREQLLALRELNGHLRRIGDLMSPRPTVEAHEEASGGPERLVERCWPGRKPHGGADRLS
jgi:hypothetical protein